MIGAAVAVSFGVAQAAVSPEEHAAQRAAPQPELVTVRPERQVLTDLRMGTCTLAVAEWTVTVPAAASAAPVAVFTSVDLAVGASVAPGTKVAEISGRPLIALDLPYPMYRDFVPLDTGPDVTAFQDALIRLGRLSGRATGTFDRATQAAVERLYRDLGAEPMRTGGELEQAANGAAAAEAALRARAAGGERVPAAELTTASAATREAQARVGVRVPFGEIVVPPVGTVSSVAVGVGGKANPETPMATVRGPAASASCKLVPAAGGGLRAGMAATLSLPTGPAPGTVGPITSGQAEVTFPFVAGFWGLPADLAGTSAPIEVTASATNGAVLTVPAGVLREAAGGGVEVEVLSSDGTTRTVPVRTGLVTGGKVEVNGELNETHEMVVSVASPDQ